MNKEKTKKVIEVTSNSLKNGFFNKKELLLYKISEDNINLILEYQNKLPILQQDNISWIDARDLWSELGVGRDYSTWIKQQINDMDLQENNDFVTTPLQRGIAGTGGFKEIIQYNIKISTAKEIAMVAGAKGGNTSAELKANSKLSRKYFIAIEDAFKQRKDWNYGRKGSLIMCKELKGSLIKYNEQLVHNLPTWIKSTNMYQNEFCLLNGIIIGMSAQRYREINKLKPNEQIRNTFTDDQLDYVERLERYDAQLINTQKIFDYEKRKKILQDEFIEISRKTVRYV